jgi:hypothetical protein
MKLGQKSVKNLVGFLGDLKTPKFHSETNGPLAQQLKLRTLKRKVHPNESFFCLPTYNMF